MHDINQLINNVRENERIARKFFEIERSILAIGRCGQFISTLTREVEKQFDVPYVWINLIDEAPLSHLVDTLDGVPELADRILFTRRLHMVNVVKAEVKTLLLNSHIEQYKNIIPPSYHGIIGSLAISPLMIDKALVGLFCQADSNSERYSQQAKDTFLLDQLAIKISICLANVTAREKLEYLATRDALTGLLNRRQLEFMLEKEFVRLRKEQGDLSLILLNCDEFKTINNALGHDCGDKVLEYVAQRLLKYIHKQGLAFRFVSDEFVLVLPGKSLDYALRIAESFSEYLYVNPPHYKSNYVPITVSFGGASVVSDKPRNYKHLLKIAEERLFHFKNDRKRFMPTKIFKFLNKPK